MNNRKKNLLLYSMVIFTIFLASCKKPKKEIPDPGTSVTPKDKRVYIINEGSLTSGSASVSFYNVTANKLSNDLFATTNGRTIGDVLQSATIINNKAYFVVNGSNKIEITDTYPLTSLGVITGFAYPRYMLPINSSKAYVTESIDYNPGTKGRISIVDLTTNTITGSIMLGVQPENMLMHNGKVYVCNSGDSTISIINPNNNTVESTINMDKGPTYILKDANGKIWILCNGSYYLPLSLVKINPSTNTVEATYSAPTAPTTFTYRLSMNGSKDILYFPYNGALYAMSINATAFPTTSFINRDFYGVGVDSISNTIYASTYGFSSNQKVIRYSSTAVPLDSFTVGIGPGTFVFTY
jgi:YVTN family beta-propeller protein